MSSMPASINVPDVLDMRPETLEYGGPIVRARKDQARLGFASWAFTTRRVPQHPAYSITPPPGKPCVGDLVLARVDAIGHHAYLHLVNGRRRHMFVGDEIVVAYGNRYASSQFESVIPETMGPCHLVAGGGIASRAVSWHARAAQGPTQITPIGLLTDRDGNRVNVRDYGFRPVTLRDDYRPTTVAVVGTSMNSGKTQTATFFVRGLIAAGLQVGYAKVTGTGAGGDIWWLKDAGANPVLDFTDVGLPSTYLASPEEIESTLIALIAHVAHAGVDAIVVEIADGVLQRETASLLRSSAFARMVGGIMLAAQDSMGASAGVDWLRRGSTPVLALSGVMTAAPLQIAEAGQATGLPVYDREGLARPSIAIDLIGQAQHHFHTRVTERVGS